MGKNKNSRGKKGRGLLILLLLLVGVGIGYAFLTSNLNINGSSNIKKAGWDVHFENINVDDGSVTATKSATIDESDKTKIEYSVKLSKPGDKYEFTVDVVNAGDIDASVSAVSKTGLTEEQAKYVDYTVTYSDGTDVAVKDLLNASSTKNIKVSVSYKTDLNPEDLPSEDKVLSLQMEVTYVQAVKKVATSLYSTIKKQAVLDNTSSEFVTSSTGIDFSKGSSDTNGKGIYMLSSTKNDKNPIYYYRGAIGINLVNNNIVFANFCWKIIRTTETGGIKLLYNGKPDENGACVEGSNSTSMGSLGVNPFNTSTNDNAYVGYMYGTAGSSTYEETHKNTNDSAIKTKIDEWYKNNMTSYTEKLEDTVWCNDRSVVPDSEFTGDGTGTNTTSYGAYNRLQVNSTPTLECKNLNDRFTVSTANGNGALTYPVALLTADEIVYAGDTYNGGGVSNGFYWTMTPYNFNWDYAFMSVYEVGRLGLIDVGSNIRYMVRPSVSLKSGTKVIDGDGSVNTPYIVQ